MLNFDLNEFSPGTAVYCETEEESEMFRHFLHEKGRRYSSGTSYLSKDYCGQNGVLYFSNGTVSSQGLLYDNIEEYEVIHFSSIVRDYEPNVRLAFDTLFRNY